MSQDFFAYSDFDCEKCGNTIFKDDEFFFFDNNKICGDFGQN